MSAIEKRMFYLMLSATEGQDYARQMGFPPPSLEVQEQEKADVLTRWGVMVATEVFAEIAEASEWFVDFLDSSDKVASNVDELKEVLSVYGVALTNKLIDSEKVVIC